MKYVLAILALFLVIYLVVAFNGRMAELHQLQTEQAAIATQLEQRTETLIALEGQIRYATSEAAVVRYAHENQMVRPGEIQIVLVPGGQVTPTPAPLVAGPAAPTPQPNWRTWWILFFGPSAP